MTQNFIRKSQAHKCLGIGRQTFHGRLSQCRANKESLPPLRKHKGMEITGYRYDELMAWWYEQETELVEGEAS